MFRNIPRKANSHPHTVCMGLMQTPNSLFRRIRRYVNFTPQSEGGGMRVSEEFCGRGGEVHHVNRTVALFTSRCIRRFSNVRVYVCARYYQTPSMCCDVNLREAENVIS